MIVKFWEREDIRNQLLATGAKYADVIGRNIDNPSDLWTHIGNGFWIGCWHPNGRDPKMPRAIWDHQVIEQCLPGKVFTPHGSGVAGGNSGIPNIRIVKTIDWPESFAQIIVSSTEVPCADVIGWKGANRELVGMAMIGFKPTGHEYEFAACRNEHAEISPEGQEGFARLESGESGGPSFVLGLDFPHLCGIHRGPGGPKGETWIAGVDTRLGHPEIHDWIMSVIGEQATVSQPVTVEPVEVEKVVRVCVSKGIKVVVEEVEE